MIKVDLSLQGPTDRPQDSDYGIFIVSDNFLIRRDQVSRRNKQFPVIGIVKKD